MSETHLQIDAKSVQLPVSTAVPVNLLGLDRDGLEAFFEAIGEKKFRATQVMKWIHQLGVVDFQDMNNLSKDLRKQLAETSCIENLLVTKDQVSADGTRKWLLQLQDGNHIEAVFIPEDERGTLCVSSQVGCALDCSFCSTGRQGFNRNLIDNTVRAVRIMMDDFAYGLSKRRVTVSTAGVVPAMDRLGDIIDMRLAVSLHATNDKLRDELVPV